ncbi:MAG: hypothetical protein N4J56_004421 [Chroococcidiopsis sp. SAG 2025]|nr:hypothetical protein [Chroococcidiopsis sp. SAG 2025]
MRQESKAIALLLAEGERFFAFINILDILIAQNNECI